MKRAWLPLIILSLCFFTGFSGSLFSSEPPDHRMDPASLLAMESSWVDSVYRQLSLKEKIGQLFMVAAWSDKEPAHSHSIIRLIQEYHIGGLIFFQGNPRDQAKLTNVYQNYSRVPLMIGMDAEWGPGMRLDSVISYPRQMALGAIQDDSLIYRMGSDIGQQLRRLGVHINFAPVVDVNNNPDNPVIGSRSFGSDPRRVARKGIAYMNGLQDEGVLSVAKHFPGHGDTDQDSHKVLPVIPHDSTRLDSIELYPFRRLVQNGVGGVMVAHLNVPAYMDDPNQPATLSSRMINGVLKEQMDFKGLVFTDALNMRGITNHYSPGRIEAQALKAGNDVLLYPQDAARAIEYLYKQVKLGDLSRQTIEQSCRKVLAFKYWAGLDQLPADTNGGMKTGPVEKAGLTGDLNKSAYQVLRQELVSGSLTLTGNSSGLLPFRRPDTLNIATVALGSDSTTAFQDMIDRYGAADHYHYTTGDDLARFSEQLQEYDLVVASVHRTNRMPSRRYGVRDEYIRVSEQITRQTKMVLVHFGNPYALGHFPQLQHYEAALVGYNDQPVTQRKAAQALFGAIDLQGRLPVDVGGPLQVGTGVSTGRLNRLSYGLPGSVGMDPQVLQRIDTIMTSAIDAQATPGGQILVARKGRVVLHKSYGTHTYLNDHPVQWRDLYDLASLTKIVSTLPALMHLYEQDSLKLTDSLDQHLPRLDTTNKGALILHNILTHQARLKSWIPFYYKTLEPLMPDTPLLDSEFSPEYPYKLGNHAYMVKNFRYKEGVYARSRSPQYPVQVSENLFIKAAYTDSIFHWIDESELLEEKDYVYSDLGYYYFYRMVERMTATALEDYVQQLFYQPLGANHMGYLPRSRFPLQQIVPTENDMVFRRELVHGHVHDPGTAMLGGVCGHAGIFSNANDLAKVMQMYLNGGNYGGRRYFKDSTIERFTHSPFREENGNRRALGFDKPVMEPDQPGPTCDGISETSFGHTGFTGTMAWADPEEQVVYIFLSNRVHPDQDNLELVTSDVRTRIQQVLYQSIDAY